MITILLVLAMLQSGPVTTAPTAEVLSGGMIRLDGRPMRLWGLATPTPGALCADDGGEAYDCDGYAREVLTQFITESSEGLAFLAGQIHTQYADVEGVRCETLGEDADGTVVGRCAVLTPNCIPQQVECQDHWTDLSREVISSGAGAQRRDETGGDYDEAEQAACHGSLGVWGVPDGAGVARRETTANCPAGSASARPL